MRIVCKSIFVVITISLFLSSFHAEAAFGSERNTLVVESQGDQPCVLEKLKNQPTHKHRGSRKGQFAGIAALGIAGSCIIVPTAFYVIKRYSRQDNFENTSSVQAEQSLLTASSEEDSNAKPKKEIDSSDEDMGTVRSEDAISLEVPIVDVQEAEEAVGLAVRGPADIDPQLARWNNDVQYYYAKTFDAYLKIWKHQKQHKASFRVASECKNPDPAESDKILEFQVIEFMTNTKILKPVVLDKITPDNVSIALTQAIELKMLRESKKTLEEIVVDFPPNSTAVRIITPEDLVF